MKNLVLPIGTKTKIYCVEHSSGLDIPYEQIYTSILCCYISKQACQNKVDRLNLDEDCNKEEYQYSHFDMVELELTIDSYLK